LKAKQNTDKITVPLLINKKKEKRETDKDKYLRGK
jgi:hypothetical protein